MFRTKRPLDFTSQGRDEAVLTVYTEAWSSLLLDSPLGQKPTRVVSRFRGRLVSHYVSIAKECAALHDLLLRNLSSTAPHITVDLYPFRRIPVFQELVAFSLTGRTDLLRYVQSFLNFGKRIPTIEDAPAKEATAFHSWLQTEDRLKSLVVDKDLAKSLLHLTSVLMHGFKHVPLPVHGSGAIAQKAVLSPSQKHKTLSRHTAVAELMSQGIRNGRLVYFNTVPEMASSRITIGDDTDARVKFVPKDMTKFRSICLEPGKNQWGQQSVMNAMYSHFRSNQWLKNIVRLEDQSFNREYARYGSLSRRVDTIDLSSASDSLSWDLVRQVIGGELLTLLGGTRSRVARYGEKKFTLAKFAPMGSATCFPVQTLIYASICLHAYHVYAYGAGCSSRSDAYRALRLLPRDGKYGNVDGLEPIRCYGDDIIVDSRITGIVIDTLTSCGFTVNHSKSFIGDSPYRESCGGYYFNGVDVSPYSLKLKDVRKFMTAPMFASLLDACNRAFHFGYSRLCSTLHDILTMWGKRGRPRVIHVDETGGDAQSLHFETNASLGRIRRFDPEKDSSDSASTHLRFQRDEQQCYFVRSVVTEVEDRDDSYGFIHWMSRHGGTENIVPRSHELRLVRGWKPL